MTAPAGRIGYRPEVDGLRALAVVPVLIFHLGIEVAGSRVLPGGFLGVDVFFVISGYLITGIILAELSAGRFSLPGFWERRARRILPALLLVVGVTIPAAYFMMTPDQMINYSQSLVAVVSFSSNLLFWKESGYFDTTTELKPLLHTWSLAVEEQFYLLFPLVLWLVWRVARDRLLFLLIGLAGISLAGAILFGKTAPDATFYFLPFRGWELLAGAIIAVWEHRGGHISLKPLSQAVCAFGLLAILASMAMVTPELRHPGLVTLPTVLGTAAILAGARNDGIVRPVLSLPLLVGVGLISYSLYLWHQPLIAFVRIYSLGPPGLVETLGVVLASLLLSYLGWRFVETPCRRRSSTATRPLIASLVLISAAIGAFGLLGHFERGLPGRLSPEERAAADSYWERETLTQDGRECHARPPEDACRIGEGSNDWVVVGDSHGPPITAALADRLDLAAARVWDFTQSGCPFLLGVTVKDDHGFCHQRNTRVMEELAGLAPSTVILVQRLPMHLSGVGFDNGEGGVEDLQGTLMVWDSETGESSGAAGFDEIAGAMERAVSRVLKAGHRLILIYPIPEAGWHVPQTTFKLKRFGPYADAEPLMREGLLTIDSETVATRLAPAHRLLDGLGTSDGLVRLRTMRLFCDRRFPGRCETEDETDTFYVDANHLSTHGANRIVTEILRLAVEDP